MFSILSRLCRASSMAAGGLAVFTFIFLPLNSVGRRLHVPEQFIEKHTLTLTVFLGILGLLFFLFHHYFEIWNSSTASVEQTPPPAPSLTSKWKAPILFSIAAIILVRAMIGIEQPFDMDEMNLANLLTSGAPITSLGPILYDATHPFSSYLSYFSAKLFGLSFWAIRLPALVFCTAFIILLVRFCVTYTSLLTGLLLIGHLASSSIFTWYFHSTRGYAPLILFSFILFSAVYEVCMHNKQLNRGNWIVLSIVLVLTPFTHGFGILFTILVPIATTLWTVFNSERLEPTHKARVLRLNALFLAFLPYLVFCLATMFYYVVTLNTKAIGVTPTSQYGKETFFGSLKQLLGSSHDITARCLLLLTLALFVTAWRKSVLKKDIVFFVLITFLGFVALQKSLLATFVTGRFFLGILPIFLFWFLQSIETLWGKRIIKIFSPILVVNLLFFPILDGNPGAFQLPHEDYYYFIRSARKTLKGIEPNCIEFSYAGHPGDIEAFVAEKYYFGVRKASVAAICPQRYQMHFSSAWPQYDASVPPKIGTFEELPPGKVYELLQKDENGRFLAKIASH